MLSSTPKVSKKRSGMCKQAQGLSRPKSTVTDHHAFSPCPLPPDVPPSRACSCVIFRTFSFRHAHSTLCRYLMAPVYVFGGWSSWHALCHARGRSCLWVAWFCFCACLVVIPTGAQKLVVYLGLHEAAIEQQCHNVVRTFEARPKDSLMVWGCAGLLEFRYYLPQTLLFLLHQPLGAWRGQARRVQINMKRDTGDDLSPWFNADIAALLLYIIINAGIRSFSSLGLDD